MSVKIIGYSQRENAEGEKFFTMTVLGSPEVVVSKDTGKAYITARRASVATTFNEATCKSLIGMSIPGSVKRVEVEEAYDFTIPESGETIKLSHQWQFVAEPTVEDVIFEGNVEIPA